MLQDLRFALRLIVKERWYSAVAVLALALGIGVNATVFAVINAALFRPLPFADPDRLYAMDWELRAGPRSFLSYAELQDWRQQSRSFSDIAGGWNTAANISGDRSFPEQVRGAWVTANTFGLLGHQPILGRGFAPHDERRGAERVAVLGHRLWQNRYGGDRNAIGQTIRVNGEPATIVGVMHDMMQFPNNAELWVAFNPTPEQERRDARVLRAYGRLRDGVSIEAARAEMNGIAERLVTAYPATNKDLVRIRLQSLKDGFVAGPARVMFITLFGAVGFLVLIACANVANLLLSRSAHRAREMAVRVAMGATRMRIVRQLLLESVVLACLGGVFGVLIALVGVPMIDAVVQDPGKPYWIIFKVDYALLAYVSVVCVFTGILFGLAPALHVTKGNLNTVLNEGGRGNAGGHRVRWLSGTMVVVELTLTIVLLVGAGLMMRSFLSLHTLDLGIETDRLMSMRLQLPQNKYPSPEDRRAFFDRLEPRLASIAGVEAIAATTSVPPFMAGERSFDIQGRGEQSADAAGASVHVVTISPQFFEVVRAPLRRGRAFNNLDGLPGYENVIVNERLAAQYFPGDDPIGRRIRFKQRNSAPGEPVETWRTIVGISPSIRHHETRDMQSAAALYVPYRQEPSAAPALLVRSQLPPASVIDAVRKVVQSVDPDQPVSTIRTLDDLLDELRWPFRVFGGIFAIVAFVALTLSAVGLYAVMAYSVTQRTQEIGVRMALGADSGQVSWMILKCGLVQLGIGLTLGLAGALALSRVMTRLLIGVTPTDPMTFVSITLLLTLVAVAACLLPARRATRVDPLVALRA
ncbi:MAG TPA: ABC transporter permease [Vicinamibacterales bacterium]|nr:ABC transporter permease [Vicinamibacterales bacterium]